MENTGTGPTTASQNQVPYLEYPSARRDDLGRQQCLVFVIPGNPGLIAYYEPFMKTLRQLLDEKEAKDGCRSAFHIHGRNLLGFADADHSPHFGTPSPSGTSTTEPFSLEDQINHTSTGVTQLTQPSSTTPNFTSVILIGHSVGSYIALELFNRHHHHHTPSTPTPPIPHLLHSAILLFPTITHIALSPSGKRLNLLRTTPLLDRTAHHIAKGFVDLLPRWLLGGVVRRVLRFPAHAAEATLQFLTSRDGIWQALHMGKDEMRVIGPEAWGRELWEAVDAVEGDEDREVGGLEKEAGRVRFWLYFGEGDHWVADEWRDEFITRREREGGGGTRVVLDEGGVPHAFCIRTCLGVGFGVAVRGFLANVVADHSEAVAEKVGGWIGEAVGI